ncbi:hypothetical protein HUT19_13075 [Streptomyces sp. NA02950]|uniref:hypothetical protein n=1 Tax=Streptomyces sp. NA02950 TaxID=2742137 RepID=UPI0015917F78|nr:hypothetical protein [Streptomyces sp. NA02950]QKV92565.1 hypothetical protein HUT19_13075 [Streptomyces sp. NA02950]
MPEKICNDRVSGDEATPLLPAEGAKFEEEAIQFGAPQSSGSCRLKRGDAEVYVTYLAGQGNYPRERIQSKGNPASLGDAYGYLSDKGGISLYVPCGPSPARDSQNRLIVGTSASVVRDTVKSSGAPGQSTPGLRALSAFAAQAARDIAQDWFKCPGADRLPDGPVTIHWGR